MESLTCFVMFESKMNNESLMSFRLNWIYCTRSCI